jgi:sialidase-1
MKSDIINKRVAIILIFSCISFSLKSQHISIPPADKWKGYERIFFMADEHIAYYVKPEKPLDGNPWIWRASFPDWHTEMDSILLVKGFYVAYINVDDQYGSPSALQAWDRFYQYLVDTLHLSAKVSLEALSRGSLYAYGWAKRNPDKVNAIYAEAPVCDIKSWPGGKGKSAGDSTAWKQLMSVYHFNERQAMDFMDNPFDHLEGLASFKVPVLHVISNNDKVVPVEENTNKLIQKYMALGGPVSIYPVTNGPQQLYGHHFPIEHADWWSDFIVQNSYPVKKMLPYNDYFNIRQGLKYFYQAVTKNKEATVAFLGGSITYNHGWRDKVCNYLKERFPETEFHFIAAGIPSLGSLAHAFRLQKDVLDSGRIDLLFVEAAVNDRVNGTDSITQVRALEGIVRHAKKSNPLIDIIMMSFADPDKIKDYDKGIKPTEIANHDFIAAHYRLPSIDLAKEIRDKIVNHEFTWENDFKDLHPSVFGQEIYFATIKKLLTTCFDRQDKNDVDNTDVKRLPNPLNKACFENGAYYGLENAEYNNDWLLDKNWMPNDNLPTRDGFVKIPVLMSIKPGAVLSLPFKGNAIGIAIVSGADAGKIAVSIDSRPFRTINLFTQWSKQLHLPWFLLLGSKLKNREHVLRIKILDEKNSNSKGNACRIVNFLINR